MTIHFSIVKDGGFAAYCDDRKIAAYAYPTSSYCEQAVLRPRDIALRMLCAAEHNWIGTPDALNGYCDHIVDKLRAVNAIVEREG